MVMVGGTSKIAARRAARFGLPLSPAANLPELEAYYYARCEEYGTQGFCAMPGPDTQMTFVAEDPDNPHFSLSFGGEAFFVVGLHPQASRPARRFSSPVLVFNLHAQFERLRAEGRYEKLRAAILERDEALAGSVNPMLARHGEASEARQYSGRAVDADWRCPMKGRPAPAPEARDWNPPALPFDCGLPGSGA